MSYNWRNTLPSYASISGLLSGFSITFIVFVLGKEAANSPLLFGISWGNFSELSLGVAAVLFIAASQYFLTAKGYDMWDLSESHLRSLTENKGTAWPQLAKGSLQACDRNESRGRQLYNWAVIVLFLGLFFAIGPFSLFVATIVASLGVGFECVQALQHHHGESPASVASVPANSPTLEIQATTSILSFYSSQLTSHAAIIIASIVAILSVVQVSTLLHLTRWQIGLSVATLLAFAVYLGVRLIVYGELTRAITHATKKDYEDFVTAFPDRVTNLFPHSLANEYAIFILNRSKLKRFYSLRRTEVRALLVFVWVAVLTIIVYTTG